MENWVLSCHLAAVMALGVYFSSYQTDMLPQRNVVIGVISARDHFSHRQAIRETWGLLLNKSDMELVFVLGENDCYIHPEDRISPHDCNKWDTGGLHGTVTSESDCHIHPEDKISSHDCNKWDPGGLQGTVASERMTFFQSQQVPYTSDLRNLADLQSFTGLGFRVIYPVILKTVSVRMDTLEFISGSYIILQDAEEVIQKRLINDQPHSITNGYYNFILESPLLMPHGFEGELMIIKPLGNGTLSIDDDFSFTQKKKWVCEWTNHSFFEYKYLRSSVGYVTNWIEKHCPLISAEFTISNEDSLMNHVKKEHQRSQDWKFHIDTIKRKIHEEQIKFGDIVKIPGVDVYANLPNKVIGFYKWVSTSRNASYVLKTDDDTFVNIDLLKNLTQGSRYNGLAWWSIFQHHRSVPLYGKWADAEYPSLAYPTFPAGAGYLMTGALIQRLSSAAGILHAYGGEDVSMGIWVAVVAGNTKQFNVHCWLPNSGCSQTILIPQLTVSQMKDYGGNTKGSERMIKPVSDHNLEM